MAGRFAVVLACASACMWLPRAMALQEEMDGNIPLEAWEAAACSAEGGSAENCQLHLLQLRAQGLTAGVDSTDDGAGVQAEDLAVPDASSGADGAGVQLQAEDLAVPDASSGADGAGVQAKDLAVHDVSSGAGVQNVSAFSSGACAAQDHAKFSSMGAGHAPGSFPHSVALCADKALKWFVFHRDVMTRCISQSLGVSMACASCYSYIGQYGYSHCKTQCVFSKWCGNGCLSCTKKSYPVVDKCAGFVAPFPSVC